MAAEFEALHPTLRRTLQFVTGKGGAGKSFVAASIAELLAGTGRRVLLLEMGDAGASRHLELASPSTELSRPEPKLWVGKLEPEASLREYALMILRFRLLYNLVFENRFVGSLLQTIPGLGAFTMLGKTWYHATEEEEGRARFDHVIVDSPATGHAKTFLSVAHAVHGVVPPGPMREAAKKMADLVASPEQTCIHLVATPEEMPVTEACELARWFSKERNLPLGLGFFNRVIPERFSPSRTDIESWTGEGGPHVQPYIETAARTLVKERMQRELLTQYQSAASLPCVPIPELAAVGRERVRAAARSIEAAGRPSPNREVAS